MIDRDQLYGRLRAHRQLLAYALYGVLAGIGYAAAYYLRFDFEPPPQAVSAFLATLPLVVVVRVVFARLFRLSSGRWRFVGTSDVVRLFITITAGSALLLLARELLAGTLLIPRSVLVMEWALSSYGTAGVWLAYRVGFERLRQARRLSGDAPQKRALIVGAGEAGNMLAREIRRFPTGYQLVGFVDDDPGKWGCRIQGTPVLGGAKDLDAMVEEHAPDEIIVAVPSAEPEDLRRLVHQVESTGVPLKILPGIAEVLQGRIGVNQVRELQIEDLLGRDPIKLDLPELEQDLDGRHVLITGAAGSIGSELARQVARHGPSRLVLLDQAETDLFYLELELRERHPDLHIVPVVTDVTDRPGVRRVFDKHVPDRVFHAAAYKHVPMMESNVEEAVKNNVIGTAVVAEAAGRHRAGRFVLVSTDKAVRPANVMGATKRMAELAVLDYQDRYPETAYGAVRFGNVLGSKGSVIPIFKKQIADGKPLTVTHPEATRYFMTIPEAAQLILQASLLSNLRGHVAMLDMGEPVKIMDLAFNFLRLSGIPAEEGESYRFIGLRPGEKMHEELSAPHEGAIETQIPKVRLLTTSGDDNRLVDLDTMVGRWEAYLSNGRSGKMEYELRRLFKGLEDMPAPPEPVLAAAADGS